MVNVINHCVRKIIYRNRRDAEAAVRGTKGQGHRDARPDRKLQAYQCQVCSRWHVGHGKAMPVERDRAEKYCLTIVEALRLLERALAS